MKNKWVVLHEYKKGKFCISKFWDKKISDYRYNLSKREAYSICKNSPGYIKVKI